MVEPDLRRCDAGAGAHGSAGAYGGIGAHNKPRALKAEATDLFLKALRVGREVGNG